MGRYFVVNTSDEGEDFITGEIVPDVVLPGAPIPNAIEEERRREGSLTLDREGEVRILTLEEMLANPRGRELLAAWMAGDDSRHDAVEARKMAEAYMEDLQMMANGGDREAQALLRRKAPLPECVAYIYREAHPRGR
jgi:hypothetical protein